MCVLVGGGKRERIEERAGEGAGEAAGAEKSRKEQKRAEGSRRYKEQKCSSSCIAGHKGSMQHHIEV